MVSLIRCKDRSRCAQLNQLFSRGIFQCGSTGTLAISPRVAQRPSVGVSAFCEMKTLLFTGWITTLALLNDASAVEFSTIEVAGKRVTICRVNVRKEQLQLFHHDETGQPFKRFDRFTAWLQPRGQKLVFAMNGGMYHRDFSAVGLYVSDGKTLAPLNTTNGVGNFFLKPNGVFLVSKAGAQVVESSEYPRLRERAIIATQSGPLLVQDGKIHPAFKPDSTNRFIRNGVGVPSPDVAVFAITEAPVNFHEFATMFRDTLHCPNALFLDGTISSLHSTELKRSDARMDLGPIIAITE
jgi:uncharacterized protein YigE (DUF2233 family)